MKRMRCLLIALLFLALPFSGNAQRQTGVYHIGILMQRDQEYTVRAWRQTANYLTDAFNGAVSFFIVPLRQDQIREAVTRREVDFLFVNPVIYVQLDMNCGVRRIATIKTESGGQVYMEYGGVILIRADRGDIRSFADLKGKRVLATDQLSLGGWLAAKRELRASGIDPERDFRSLSFALIPEEVIQAVLDGTADAGIVRSGVLEQMAVEGKLDRSRLIVLGDRSVAGAEKPPDGYLPAHSTRLYPEWPFAVTPQVPWDMAEEVARALLGMQPDHMACVVGNYAGWTIPLNYQSVNDCLRELREVPYENYGRVTLSGVVRTYWPWLAVFTVLFSLLVLENVVAHRSGIRLRREIVMREQIEKDLAATNRKLARNELALKNMLYDMKQTNDELRLAQQQLVQSEKLAAIGRLATGIAHEINNPLMVISGRAQLSMSGPAAGGTEKLRDNLKIIQGECMRAKGIIQRLLSFSRPGSGVLTDIDVVKSLRDIVLIVQDQYLLKGIRVTVSEKGPIPPIRGDEKQLQEVFFNLLTNAHDAMEKGGALDIVVQYQGGPMIRIDIADEGIGMSDITQKNIFEPFFTTKAKGTGLGLSICLGIIKKHGGDIACVSAPGRGTTMTVTLPVKQAHTQELPQKEAL